MALNQLPREEILQIFAESKGDQQAAFDEVEKRMRLGLVRYYTAECEVCGVFKFPAFDNRNTWAENHSKVLHNFEMPDSEEVQKRTCSVHVSEVWE